MKSNFLKCCRQYLQHCYNRHEVYTPQMISLQPCNARLVTSVYPQLNIPCFNATVLLHTRHTTSYYLYLQLPFCPYEPRVQASLQIKPAVLPPAPHRFPSDLPLLHTCDLSSANRSCSIAIRRRESSNAPAINVIGVCRMGEIIALTGFNFLSKISPPQWLSTMGNNGCAVLLAFF